ncbi:MAG: AAA family ATPase [Bacteroidales bacterium]|nr:AAA family ATPase [Bacteroidales bacterium]
MKTFKETITNKEELIKFCKEGKQNVDNGSISKNDFLVYFGFIHGEAITKFYPGNSKENYKILVDVGFSTGSEAYFSAGINAWKHLMDGLYTLPPIEDIKEENTFSTDIPLQQIYFGAPGTGKSHDIERVIGNRKSFRVTFHPDTDYSSFVGAYKPTMNEQGDKIIYTYVKQAFLNAYIEAWKEQENENPQPVFLVIEEINRGNCAQIFGDIFQLLDRNDNGFSDYAVVPDTDLSREVKKDLENLNIVCKDCEKDMISKVLKGEVLLLPNNLHILATMNTSDQSLFPIDSAFKRRWDWKYIKIANENKNWKIKIGNTEYDWWQFVQAINYFISEATDSEDKNLGYFFAKAKNGIISAETFVSKVIFYLYTDVFKDYVDSNVFTDENKNKMTFQSFYNADGSANEDQIIRFIENVIYSDELPEDLKVAESEEELQEKNSKLLFKVGNESQIPQRKLALTALKQYVNNNPELTADQIISRWKPLSNVKHFIESETEYTKTITNAPSMKERMQKVELSNGESVYITLDGWVPDTSKNLMNAINEKKLGIDIEIISE